MFQYYSDGPRTQYAPVGMGDVATDVSNIINGISNAGDTVRNLTDAANYMKPFMLVTVGLLVYIAAKQR